MISGAVSRVASSLKDSLKSIHKQYIRYDLEVLARTLASFNIVVTTGKWSTPV